MKVVGICGSPRKVNTEWMLRNGLSAVLEATAGIPPNASSRPQRGFQGTDAPVSLQYSKGCLIPRGLESTIAPDGATAWLCPDKS
jgi:hypothetical protein